MSVLSLANRLTTIPPNMNTGSITIPRMNALLRMALRYSVTAILRILGIIDFLGFRAGDANENVVQRRPRNFEQVNARSGGKRLQQFLGIAGVTHFLVLPQVANTCHARKVLQMVASASASDPQSNRVLAVRGLNRCQRAVENFPSLV